MKLRLTAALLSSISATAASAQVFPRPPDVPPFNEIARQYKTDGTQNTVVDSTVTPMPVTPLTNIPIPSTTNRLITDGPFDGTASPYCKTIPFGGTCFENKFRTLADFSHMLPDDPIRNSGQPGSSHLHCFFGAGSTNANSTYKTLRQHSLNSAAAGTDVNATGYWYPCLVVLNPYANGKNYAVKPDHITVYYTENAATDGTGAGAKAFIPTGMRYVFGFDMDASSPATQYAWLQADIDAANIASGHTRYSLVNPGTGTLATQVQYSCVGATPSTVSLIKNADGSDPFGGTCASGADFFINIGGPKCFDGNNLWSPGGYKNLIPEVWDGDFSKPVCPTNYYKLPGLTLEIHFTQYGWSDRQRWDLSSDISYRAAHGLTSAQLPPGTTFHTDWLDGWDDVQRRKWEINGLGVEHNIGHEMNSSQINDHERLKGGLVGEAGAAGRNPQVDFSAQPRVNESDAGWMLIPPAWSGALTGMHMHH